jgi:hypothetical protein
MDNMRALRSEKRAPNTEDVICFRYILPPDTLAQFFLLISFSMLFVCSNLLPLSADRVYRVYSCVIPRQPPDSQP